MTHTRLWMAAAIIAVVIFGGFILSVPRAAEAPYTAPAEVAAEVPVVTLRDAYRKGVHTLSGSVTAPDACTSVTAEATLLGGTTSPSILVAIAMPPSSGICLKLPTEVPFKLTLTAPADVPIAATINGAPASTTP